MVVVAAIAVGGVIVLDVRAQEGPRKGLRGQFLERAKEKLGLTDEQMGKIKTELGAEKGTLSGLLTSLHDARVGLREVIQKNGATESEIRAASAKVAAVEADLAVERAKLYGRISPILTAEQLAKVSEFQQRVDDFMDDAIKSLGERLAQ
ncbi:MAG: hypothetical protein JWR19_240 [Pedosphaera sp.]|nr:hypothetical protein [Pedosphaera sp.]